jgi:transcriptional regulator with XRE-family HTH domain
MPRPQKSPFLVPRQPKTLLGWSMQKARQVHGWTVKRTAQAFGCSSSHISRVEHGSRPSRALVQFYDETFAAEGLLLSIFEVVEHAPEQDRRRSGGRRAVLKRGISGDASRFVDDTIPHGTLMKPGAIFLKTWRIRNSGTVAWRDRWLERQGPIITVGAPLLAPTYDCASIAYFKMTREDGTLCFPDSYQLGLDVLVLVRGQAPDRPQGLETEQ